MMRSGAILISVMILTLLAGMVAAGLMFRMQAAVSASAAIDNGQQAYEAAMSGVHRAVVVISENVANMDVWYDNPDLFKNQKVYDDGANVWYFTVYAPDPLDRTVVRYGPVDECAKMHINRVGRSGLQSIPFLTNEMIDCLIDYRDGNDRPEQEGAEQEYYDRLPFPYVIKNAGISTVEELLLVKGFSAAIVYGEDANLNGLLDPNEDDGDETFPSDDADGELNPGMRGLATTISYQGCFDSEGNPRQYMNRSAVQLIEGGIPPNIASFVELCRKDGRFFTHCADLLNAEHELREDQADYEGKRVPAGTTIESGVGINELPLVLDKLEAGAGGMKNIKHGLININTAPFEVLNSVNGIDESAARSIVVTRTGLDGATKSTIAWLYTQGILDEENFRKAARGVTARSYQYRIQCIGFGVPCGRIRVLEVLVDIAWGYPQIKYLRDLTRLGVPFALDLELEEESES